MPAALSAGRKFSPEIPLPIPVGECYNDIRLFYANEIDVFKEVFRVASVCEICHKYERSGMNVSHSHLKTKRTWKPNIQRVRAVVDGEVKRVNVCTRCLRSGKVQRAI